MLEKKPIRVLQVLTIMNIGGAESMIMNYYRNIDRSKIQFDFLLHRQENGFYDNEILSLGGRIFKLEAIHPRTFNSYLKNLRAFFSVNKEYQIVHSHLNALSFVVLKEAKRNGIPVRISHSHTSVDPASLKKIFEKNTDRIALIKNYIQHLVRRRVHNVANQYFACGEKAGEWLFGKENENKIKIINNAIDSKAFTYDPILREEVIREVNLPNKTIIGHVGRFNEEKNHHFLINVFKELSLKDESYHLLLVGDGPLKPKVEARVLSYNLKNRVTFLGIRKDVHRILQAMDIFAFPSIYEGFPVTLVEAQASGLKIICSDQVTRDVDLTGLVNFLPINQGFEIWVERIISETTYIRKDTLKEIMSCGYDIKSNAKELQEFYKTLLTNS